MTKAVVITNPLVLLELYNKETGCTCRKGMVYWWSYSNVWYGDYTSTYTG